jgi:2-oxoglutarate ferredoxin oxidoreductase subunit alpha
MLDLDIGMNEWLCKPLAWDDGRALDRGKVLSAEELEAGREFGRYLDVDGDGVTYRTYPGTHPSRGAFFTRGTSKNRMARYSEEGADYVENMQRLLRKFETAKGLVPAPIRSDAAEPTRYGAIYYGSTAPAMSEALEALAADGIHLDTLRVRGFPFADTVIDFVLDHDIVFLIEQNRDAQLRTLLINEGALDPARILPVLHYDGTPITARFIIDAVARQWRALSGAAHRDAAE